MTKVIQLPYYTLSDHFPNSLENGSMGIAVMRWFVGAHTCYL
jgi:hypothetical protein